MVKRPLVKDWERWKQIKANMALEGHYISDEELAEVAREYEESGDDMYIDRAVAIAKKTGESVLTVFDRLKAEAAPKRMNPVLLRLTHPRHRRRPN